MLKLLPGAYGKLRTKSFCRVRSQKYDISATSNNVVAMITKNGRGIDT